MTVLFLCQCHLAVPSTNESNYTECLHSKGKPSIMLSEGKTCLSSSSLPPRRKCQGPVAATDWVGVGSKRLTVVEAQALVTTEVLCAFELVAVLILKHGCWSINPLCVRFIKIVSLMRWWFYIKCIFSMSISVIFNFSNESGICCSSLELSGGLVLYVIDFKNLFMLLSIIYCFYLQKRDFFLCNPTVLEV